MNKVKIGFLPFYIKLYDDIGSGAKARPRLEPFAKKLADLIEERGFEVFLSPFCRIESEFDAAIKSFEEAGCSAIVTWHAAYSPSLESVGPLSATKLPIVVLDTTETFDFGPSQDQGEIAYCQGIHGVMDMCNMLHTKGKTFAIAAGHIDNSDVIDRVAGYLRAAVAATSLAGSKTASIGGSFDGMGDFLVPDADMLSRFGVEVVYPKKNEFAALIESVDEAAVEAEMALDRETYYEIEPVDEETHRRTVKNSLAVRKWINDNGIDAFTANFREIAVDTGLEIMPFMEACKSMARGIGYAGEGDVLTASLVGALLSAYDETSFIEIFCPDWKNDTLLLCHMGEYNPNLTAFRPGMKGIKFIFGDTKDPVVSYGCYKAGEATFVNLYRTNGDFKMVISPVTMQEVKEGEDPSFAACRVRGWMKPRKPIAQFLEELSLLGATHHSALVYGATPREIAYFAQLLRIEYDII